MNYAVMAMGAAPQLAMRKMFENPRASDVPVYATRYTIAPRRILIVEDNIESVRALAGLLSEIGHSVLYAINGYAAIQYAREFKPDFVLLDIGLPGMDGYEVCRQVKQEVR